MVLKKSGDDEIEVQDGWRGRIIPLELMAKTKFAADLEKIGETERAAEQIESELASLATEVPDDERENVLKESGEEFDPKSVGEKTAEFLADVATPEIDALKGYLALNKAAEKKAYIDSHPEVDWASMNPAAHAARGPFRDGSCGVSRNSSSPKVLLSR